MATKTLDRFDDVAVICKATVFFEGKGVSHPV